MSMLALERVMWMAHDSTHYSPPYFKNLDLLAPNNKSSPSRKIFFRILIGLIF